MKNLVLLFIVLGFAYLCGCQRQERETPKAPGIDRPDVEQTDRVRTPENPNVETQRTRSRPPFTNTLGMKFAWIPPGSFMMGSPKEEKERGPNETQHKVTLTKGFYMGVHEITQEVWTEVMGEDHPRVSMKKGKLRGEKNLPVERVGWDECQEFIKKLREKDKNPYRLPTEAEWEYACRAGTTTPFHYGETISTDQANYAGEVAYGHGAKGVSRKKTTPVGSFPPNPWGLYDMHGNVYEWCHDWYGDYPREDAIDPQGPKTGNFRVLRSGCWSILPDGVRSAYRSYGGPAGRYSDIRGFRICFFAE